ncbi:MAG TPA: hypothetical protein VGH28_29520 [Polyangiaceae bacterium]|jgi:hypothetical protein
MNASWMSLLSELTLGDGAGSIRAEVHADSLPRRNPLRLVVQTYESRTRRRLGSIQRAVTSDELLAGVSVEVPHVAASDARVVAWVEGGAPNLEHDGLTARPRRGSLVGFGRGDEVCIHLSRRS